VKSLKKSLRPEQPFRPSVGPPGCADEDLPAQSKVELPLWLALKLESTNVVKLEYPK
jgi:hypothetical protein